MWYDVLCCDKYELIADVTCPILFYSILFPSILFCSIPFCSVISCYALFYSTLFWSIIFLFYFILFSSLLFCSDLFCPVLPDSFLFCILFWSGERSSVIPNKDTIVKTQSRAIKKQNKPEVESMKAAWHWQPIGDIQMFHPDPGPWVWCTIPTLVTRPLLLQNGLLKNL